MFTVIFVNKRTEIQRQNYQFLFQPFVDAGEICFCHWEESGESIDKAVSNLYPLLKGKKEWRAIILDTTSAEKKDGNDGVQARMSSVEQKAEPVKQMVLKGDLDADKKTSNKAIQHPKLNPFDYSGVNDPEHLQGKSGGSNVPIIRLTHMLAGYEFSSIRGFKSVFEYVDERTHRSFEILESSFDAFFVIQKIIHDDVHSKEVQLVYSSLPVDSQDNPNAEAIALDTRRLKALEKKWRDPNTMKPTQALLEFHLGDDCNGLSPDRIYFEYLRPKDDEDLGSGEVVRLSLQDYCLIGDILKREEPVHFVYKTEFDTPEHLQADNELKNKYHFADHRPCELILFATRDKSDKDEKKSIHQVWNPAELNDLPGLFWQSNRYPACCRFVYMDIMQKDNIRFELDMFQYWMAVLLLAHNNLGSDTLKAYNLYRIHLDLDEERLCQILNHQLNQLNAAYKAVETELQYTQDQSFAPDDTLLSDESVTISFGNDSAAEMANAREMSYFTRGDRREAQKRLEDENEKIKQEQIKSSKEANKMREFDRAVQNIRMRALGFLPRHYLLDDYQIEELREKKRQLERDLLLHSSNSPEAFKKILKEEAAEQEQKMNQANREREKANLKIADWGVLKTVGIIALSLIVLGNGTYIVQSAMQKQSTGSNLISLGGALLVTLFIVLCGAVCVYIVFRRYQRELDSVDAQYKETVRHIQDSDKKHETSRGNFYSNLLTYFKLQAISRGMNYKHETDIDARRRLLEYTRKIHNDINRNEKWLRLYSFDRVPVSLTYAGDFLESPRKNPIFYFETADEEDYIPLNQTGEVASIYPFVKHVWIERDYLLEEDAIDNGDTSWGDA